MGLFDSIRKAAAAVTSSTAKVSLTPAAPIALQGQETPVVVSIIAGDKECEHQGVYIDLVGVETISVKLPTGSDWSTQKETVKHSFKIADGGKIAASQAAHVVGAFTVPKDCPVTYDGLHTKHAIALQARLEQPGQDPTSSTIYLTVIKRP